MAEDTKKTAETNAAADVSGNTAAGTSESAADTAGKLADDAAAAAEKRKKTRARNKLIRRVVGIGVLLAALGGGGYAFAQHQQRAAAEKAAESQAKTGTASVTDITEKISSTGTIAPKDTYSITALVTGTIVSADFEEGDQVTKGQVLYQVDASSMDSQLTNNQNSLTRAEKNLAKAKENYAEAQARYGSGVYTATQAGFVTAVRIVDGQKISNGTALLELTDDATMQVQIPFLSGEIVFIPVGSVATLTLSDTLEQVQGTVIATGEHEIVLEGGRLVRYVTIEVANPGGLTTDTSVSANINGFDCVEEGTFEPRYTATMNADLDGSVDCVQVLVHVGDYVAPGTPIFSMASNSVRDILDDFSDKVDTQQSSVESAQQKIDSTNETIDNYTITAPIDGQVSTKSYKVGDKIGSNSGQNSSTNLATIYDMSAYTFEMSIDETDITKIQIGQKVEVTADAFDGEHFSGKVTNISLASSVSNGVSTYPVVVTMDSTDKLLPGMNVSAEIVIASAENALVVPTEALMRGNRVYVKDDTVTEAQGSVPAGFRAVQVKTGLTNEDYVQITSGELSDGDVVYLQESTVSTNMQWGGMGGMGGPGGPGGMGGQGGNRTGGNRTGGNRSGGGGR